MTNGMPAFPPPAPSGGGSRGWITAAVLLLVVGGGAGWAWWRRANASSITGAPAVQGVRLDDTTARAPGGARVVVRVVNASGVRGLGRRATMLLRDFGYDVVDYDTDRRADADRTEIIAHTGHEDWGVRLQRALGAGTVTARADSLRYVDLTVRLGRDWQPPAEPLRP